MHPALDPGSLALGSVSLACFAVGEQVYGIDVREVCEVVRCVPVTPLPQAPLLIEGVVDLRGTVVPLVDLGRLLGGSPGAAEGDARIAVVEHDGLVFGLRVDAAVDVINVADGEIEAPPELAARSGYQMLRGMLRRPGAQPVLVLSLAHAIERVHASGVAQAGHA